MKRADFCGACGAPITPQTSFISETGVLCSVCFGRWDLEQRAAQNATNAREAVLLRKASRLAQLQGVNAAVAVILLAGWVHVPGGLASLLIGAIILMSYGMRLRRKDAFWAALVLDTAGSLTFGVASVTEVRDGRLVFLLFPVVFAWWLGVLTWRARDAFLPPSPDVGPANSNEVPR